jgi:hypothetical protein
MKLVGFRWAVKKVNVSLVGVLKASSEINFKETTTLYDKDSFNYGQDYEKFKTIMVLKNMNLN